MAGSEDYLSEPADYPSEPEEAQDEPEIRPEDPFAPCPFNRIYHTLASPGMSFAEIKGNGVNFRKDPMLHGCWPERLLHVDSMTSYQGEQRSDGVYYNNFKEPAFSALSYKWGLHVVDDGPVLEVEGTDWVAPCIDQNYFTVAQHMKVLEKMGEQSGWVWVDVGCITQLLMEETMREIIVEPQYFRQATQQFVWWVDYPSEILQEHLNLVHKALLELRKLEASHEQDPNLTDIPVILNTAYAPLEELLSMPWFSSNWTLREIMLCDNIVILDREANEIYIDDVDGKTTPATIDMLSEICMRILTWLSQWQSRLEPITDLTNKLVILGVAMTSSTASPDPVKPEDTPAVANSTIKILLIQYLDLLEKCPAFFLYTSAPSELHYWTKALLTTGRLIIEGKAGEMLHQAKCLSYDIGSETDELPGFLVYHGWGDCMRVDCHCSMLCRCTGDCGHNGGDCSYSRNYKDSRYSFRQDNTQKQSVVCIPCMLGFSFKVKEYEYADAHTAITLDPQEAKEKIGPKVRKYRDRDTEDALHEAVRLDVVNNKKTPDGWDEWQKAYERKRAELDWNWSDDGGD